MEEEPNVYARRTHVIEGFARKRGEKPSQTKKESTENSFLLPEEEDIHQAHRGHYVTINTMDNISHGRYLGTNKAGQGVLSPCLRKEIIAMNTSGEIKYRFVWEEKSPLTLGGVLNQDTTIEPQTRKSLDRLTKYKTS